MDRYALGSARGGLRPHDFSGVKGFSQQIVGYEPNAPSYGAEVPLVARPGDLLVHDALMIHRAEPNRSWDRHRGALGAIFYGESAAYDQAAYEARQQEIARRSALLAGQSAPLPWSARAGGAG